MDSWKGSEEFLRQLSEHCREVRNKRFPLWYLLAPLVIAVLAIMVMAVVMA